MLIIEQTSNRWRKREGKKTFRHGYGSGLIVYWILAWGCTTFSCVLSMLRLSREIYCWYCLKSFDASYRETPLQDMVLKVLKVLIVYCKHTYQKRCDQSTTPLIPSCLTSLFRLLWVQCTKQKTWLQAVSYCQIFLSSNIQGASQRLFLVNSGVSVFHRLPLPIKSMRGRPGWSSEVGLELNKAQEVERSEKVQGQHYDLWFLTCEPMDKGKKQSQSSFTGIQK